MATTSRATWWSLTAFNNEIEIIEDKATWPSFIKTIYGGRETCPNTEKLHFQGAIQCHTQVRMSQLKQWLPKAHLEQARNSEMLKKYAMKTETAAGEKAIRESVKIFYDAQSICQLLAEQVIDQTDRQTDNFWARVRKILAKSPELTSQLMNPSLRNFYINTASVWETSASIVLQKHLDCKHGTECGGCLSCEPIRIYTPDLIKYLQ